MRILDDERQTFTRVGTVAWDPIQLALRWTWKPDVPSGYVVYLMVVGDDVKKGGKAEDTSSSTFKTRIKSEFSTAGQVIRGPLPGRPLANWRSKPLDPFKRCAPAALLEGDVVEFWAKALPTKQSMENEEDRISIEYRGEWTKEGWTRSGQRRWAESEER